MVSDRAPREPPKSAGSACASVAWIPPQLRELLSLARHDRRPSLPTTTPSKPTPTIASHDGLERTYSEPPARPLVPANQSAQVFRILGDCSHLLSKCILIFAIHRNRSSEGTQPALLPLLLPLPLGPSDDGHDAG